MAYLSTHFRFHAPRRGSDALLNCMCTAVMVVMICLATTSCNSSSDEPAAGTYAARVNVDWSGYGNDSPTGMTLLFHHSTTGAMVTAADNNTDHTTTRLTEGRHWTTVFNLTPDEFENIGFRGLESVAGAEVYARECVPPEWLTLPYDDNSYVACQPPRLAADTILTAAVVPTSEPRIIGTLHPRNIIHSLHITVATGTPDALIAARGAISGLASGRKLASDTRNTPTVIHLIESDSWTRSADASVSATVRCFGLPNDHRGRPDENVLEFQALLADGKTVKRYTLPVGHLIKDAAGHDNGLDITIELTLDPALPSVGNAGNIDVWIKDWDGSIDVNLPL